MDSCLKGIIPVKVWEECGKEGIFYEMLREIRVRINQPIIIIYEKMGKIEEYISDVIAVKEVTEDLLNRISKYSLYAYLEELRNGFITIKGGHRIGITGKAVLDINSEGEVIVTGIKYINFFNIRVAHEKIGCSNFILKYLYEGENLKNTLIISSPCRGKTTILRDLVRNISEGSANIQGKKVALIDERGEIAGSVKGCPQMNIGKRTDVLEGTTKIWGTKMIIRSMSAQLIALDEIGLEKDIEAILEAVNAGINILATIHGNSLEDVKRRCEMKNLMENKIFDRYIIISNSGRIGEIEAILDGEGKIIAKGRLGD